MVRRHRLRDRTRRGAYQPFQAGRLWSGACGDLCRLVQKGEEQTAELDLAAAGRAIVCNYAENGERTKPSTDSDPHFTKN